MKRARAAPGQSYFGAVTEARKEALAKLAAELEQVTERYVARERATALARSGLRQPKPKTEMPARPWEPGRRPRFRGGYRGDSTLAPAKAPRTDHKERTP